MCEGDLHVSIGDSHLLESHMAAVKLTRTHCAEGQSSISISICKIMKKYCSSLTIGLELSSYEGKKQLFPTGDETGPTVLLKASFSNMNDCH